MSYTTSNYTEQGGAASVIGGTQTISGAQTVSGTATNSGTLNLNGTVAVGAAAVTKLGGATVATVATVHVRATALEVNGAAGKTVVAAVTGYKIKVLDWKMIARGGAVGTATGVDLQDSNSSPVSVCKVARAGLTENNVVTPSTATHVTNGAGSCGAELTAAKNLVLIKDGSDVDTATHIDAIVTYTLVAAT